MSTFSEVFIALRKGSGYSQADMAEKLNVSKSAVGMWETGQRGPTREKLEEISDFFNVDTDYLLGRSSKSTYYINPSVALKAQRLLDDPKMSTLFDSVQGISDEQMDQIIAMIKIIKGEK